MDDTTTKALQMAQTLIKAGKQEQAEDILVMIVRSSPNVEEAWYLLGFALIDTQKRIDSFQQLLCINSSHQLAKQLLANLQTIRLVSPFTEDTPTVPQNAFMAGRLSQISNEPGSETADQSFVCAPAQPVEVSEPDLTCADDSSQMQSALRLEVETETATPPAKSRARQRSMRIMVGVATLVVLFSGLTIRWLWRSAAQVAVLPPVTNPTSALATSATPLPITSTITTLPQFNAEFRGTACPFSIPLGTQIKCGLVKVPRDRAKNFTDLIMLPVVLFHSKKAGADVIVYLQGGPGQEAINWSLANFDDFVSPLLDEQDMLFFDPRGTGRSAPALNCPQLNPVFMDAYYQSRSQAEAFSEFNTQWLKCQERFTIDGLDPATFTTPQSAADVRDIARAMGYEKIRLLGISYGTRLGLTVMRDYPGLVRSGVLDSAVPLQAKMFNRRASDLDYAL